MNNVTLRTLNVLTGQGVTTVSYPVTAGATMTAAANSWCGATPFQAAMSTADTTSDFEIVGVFITDLTGATSQTIDIEGYIDIGTGASPSNSLVARVPFSRRFAGGSMSPVVGDTASIISAMFLSQFMPLLHGPRVAAATAVHTRLVTSCAGCADTGVARLLVAEDI